MKGMRNGYTVLAILSVTTGLTNDRSQLLSQVTPRANCQWEGWTTVSAIL